MYAVTCGCQCLCVAGLVLQFLILFKCCPITVTITIPRRTANNVTDTVELMTLRAVGRSVTQCLAATEQWPCLENQLLRFVDAVAQDNSTWQWGDYIFVEKLTGNKSEKQLNFSRNQAPRQRSVQAEGDSQHNESGIVAGLLQLAKTRSIRLQLPTSVGTLKKIGAGISNAIDGLSLQNIAPPETLPETEAAQADEGTHRLFNGLVDDKLETFSASSSDDTIFLQNDKDKIELDKNKDKDSKKKKKEKHKKTKKKKVTKDKNKHKKDKYKDRDKKKKEKDKCKGKDKNKTKKDKYKDKNEHKDKDKHKKKLVIKEGLSNNYNSLKGRKKKGKDKNMAMMGGMAMMAMVAQMFLGKVILIAGAAFVMAKVALLVSVLGSLKKGSTGSSVSTERIVVTGQGHGSGGGHGRYEHDEGWHRRHMPHIYPAAEIISEGLQPVKAYHHSPTPPPPPKASASHQNHRYYVNEINEAANEDIDDGYRRRQAQAGFL